MASKWSVYSPSVAKLRRAYKRVTKPVRAILGDDNDVVYSANDPLGTIRVRFVASADANGNATYSDYTLVRSGVGNYIPSAGRGVWVGVGYDGELQVLDADLQDLEQAGIDARAVNPSSPQRQFVSLSDATRLMSRPVATVNTDSLLVNVQPAIFDFYGAYVPYNGTQLQADKVDLTSLVPTAGNHAVIVVWLSLLDNTASATTSTPQGIGTALDATDVQEAFDDRPFDAVPVQAYRLQNAQSTILTDALLIDLRQFINVPDEIGIPSITSYRYSVRSARRVLTFGTMTIEKTLNNEGMITIL